MAVPVKADLEAALASLAARLKAASSRQMDNRLKALAALGRALPSLDSLLALPRRRFDEAATALGRSLELSIVSKRARFDRSAAAIRPDAILGRIGERRQRLVQLVNRGDHVVDRNIDRLKGRIASAEASLRGLPGRLDAERMRRSERLAGLSDRAAIALSNRIDRARQKLAAQDRVLQSLSFREVLKRGYAVVRDEDNHVLTSALKVGPGRNLSVQWADGVVSVTTEGDGEPPRRKAPKADSGPRGGQGSLF